MSQFVFVDTGTWFASLVAWDSHHQAAVDWMSAGPRSWLTTDAVLSETLTLLRVRGEHARALWLGAQVWSEIVAVLYFVDRDDQAAAWDVFQRFADKEWSFVDCLS